MKKTFKNITLYTLMVAFLFTMCGKKLEVSPTTQLDADQTAPDVELMLIGAYSLIGSGGVKDIQEGGLYGTDLILNADLLASENYLNWQGTFNQYNEIAYKAMSSTNTSVLRIWRKGYSAIGLCNTILENIARAPADKQARIAAEAKFIRGVVHFELLRFYGEASTDLGVPIMLKSTQSYEEITFPARASIAQTYAQVIADLSEAAAVLPYDNDVYADKYSAYGFLARVYLQKGDYPNAFICADSVIAQESKGKYRLPTNSIESAFNSTASTESVFEIQQTTNNNAGTTNDGLTTFYGCDPDIPGSASRGDVDIITDFINLYDSTDKRRSVLIYEGTCGKPRITSGKWKNPYTNIPVIRLSEMYLIRAEAGFRTGAASSNPLDDINAIRSKANAAPYSSVDLDAILLERDLELAFEGHRIHDYRRTGKIITMLDEDGNPYDVDYTGPEFIMPIPQTDINTNKNLIQNSYYR